MRSCNLLTRNCRRLMKKYACQEIKSQFLESVFTSLPSSVVILDRDLHVQIWNRKAEDMWFGAEEVEGQHFLNLDIGLGRATTTAHPHLPERPNARK